MIPTPYKFEASFTREEFQKLGQFASRWAHIEHTIGNCLRRVLNMDAGHATIVVFPLGLEMRMQRIGEVMKRYPLPPEPTALYGELRPLVTAMQYLRNTVLHGVVIGEEVEYDTPVFHLRSKGRNISKAELFGCEDLINYAAHVALAFRLSLGEKEDFRGPTYALPDRPPIPDFLPNECRAFPKPNKASPQSPR